MEMAERCPENGLAAQEITGDHASAGPTKAHESVADDVYDARDAEPPLSVAHAPREPADKWRVELPPLLVSTNLTLEKFHALKWQEIARLSRLLRAPRFRRVRLAGDDRALYESFYRSFPHGMVAKARFAGVARAVLGVEATVGVQAELPPDARALCRHLEAMQYSYELSADNVPMLNWRLLLVGLHLFQHPLLSLREHIAWGFRVFGSVGFLDALADATTIATSDLALLLTQLLRNQACRRLVSERLRQAQVLEPTGTLTPANVRQHMTSMRVSYRRFQELASLAPLRALFDRATEHTVVLEEMATPLYRELAFRARKKHSDRKKIDRLRYFHRTKRMRHAFFLWSERARVMKRTRVIMAAAFRRLIFVKKAHGFARLKRHAIQSWAATEIQRMARGMIGRGLALDQWTLVQAAIKVQGAFRMRSHFVRFLKDARRRHRAAIHVQRVYRGRVGRIAARTELLAYYYAEVEKLQRDREAFRAVVRDHMARRVQRLFHLIVERQREARTAQDARARKLVELEMEDMLSEATREVRRRKMEISSKYTKLREAHEYKQRRKQIDSAEKAKVIRLRRQRQWDTFKSARLATRERQKRDAAVAHGALQTHWQTEIAERVKRKRLFLSQVLELEEPGEWKALQKQLKALVANREKELAVKYKQSQVAVPKREVYDRAKIEILDDEVEKERHAAEVEWLKVEADFFYDLDVKEEERTMTENAEERKRREKCAVVVQSAFRMFAARKQLKAEIRQCFVKEFDTKTQLAMYRNTYLSGERPSARKPYGLGPDDLDFPDNWVLIDDELVGQPFFYHPQTLRQSWEMPDECRCCSVCAATSNRIAFAVYWNAEEDSYLCLSCYTSRKSSAAFNPDEFYPYDGSKRGGY